MEIYTELSLKNKATIFPSCATLRNKPKESKSMAYQRDTCTSMFVLVLFTIAWEWICHSCPEVEKNDKENEVHIHTRILCSHKKQNSNILKKMAIYVSEHFRKQPKTHVHLLSPCLSNCFFEDNMQKTLENIKRQRPKPWINDCLAGNL